jgi:hypothetical protein
MAQRFPARVFAALALAAVAGFGAWWAGHRPPPAAPKPVAATQPRATAIGLPQQIYIWQRRWGPAVQQGVGQAAPLASGFVALGAEVRFTRGEMNVVRVAIDYEALRAGGRPIGVALRIGACPGPCADDAIAQRLANLAAGLADECRQRGAPPVELQLDFDAASSKLAGYRTWVTVIGRRIAPVPLTITALPTWLDEPAFAALAAAAPNYVLQVHSVEKPAGGLDAVMTLCDPVQARRWVAKADHLGVPFRVALPTYGYRMAFDVKGQLLGLAAEGPTPAWPEDATLRDLRADPAALAGLVQAWTRAQPINLRGIIWYRLPVADEALNWRWPTLAAVMAGRVPQPALGIEATAAPGGLVDLALVNRGEADAPLAVEVTVQWPQAAGATRPAADALGGFDLAEVGTNVARFRAAGALALERLPPGQRRVLGWLRFEKDTEVQAHVTQFAP